MLKREVSWFQERDVNKRNVNKIRFIIRENYNGR